MTLAAGTRLGPYEIVAPLGAGGMGEVYRARDTRLGRDVAVKVLPDHLSAHPEVRARFEREARTVSALNHPHICTLHDVGSEGGTSYLVMELVEGETLAQRLSRGALPLPEVLRLGAQIADALDRAHRAGVVHRDLKPGNVMLTRTGAKLLDFGLARAAGAVAPPDGGGATQSALANSPTVAQPLTAEGAIVGTFQYMAPEQLEGREADARSDLWSLGCVLHEMATGARTFEARSQAGLIGAILHAQPAPVSRYLAASPPGLDRLVAACLAKDPADRVQSAHDVRLQLEWMAENAGPGSESGARASTAASKGFSRAALAGVALLAIATTVAVMSLRSRGPGPALAPPQRYVLGAAELLAAATPALSPDGTCVVFAARDAGVTRLFRRAFDSFELQPIAGTEDGSAPFFSPDGEWIGFVTTLGIKKVPAAGGAALTVLNEPRVDAGEWAPDGTIYYTPRSGGGDGLTALARVASTGGPATVVARLDSAAGESEAWLPEVLPDGRTVLFTIAGAVATPWQIVAVGPDGARHQVVENALLGRYVSSGHLLYYDFDSQVVLCAPFDARRARVTGPAVPLTEQVDANHCYDVSEDGKLVYVPVAGAGEGSEVVWLDRSGRATPAMTVRGTWAQPRVSPDGSRILLRKTGTNCELWLLDVERGTPARIAQGHDCHDPVWSPDGRRIAYQQVDTRGEITTLAVGGPREVTRISFSGLPESPQSWSAEGNHLAYTVTGRGTRSDIWVRGMDGGAPPAPFLATEFNETDPAISPDGRWIAYVSNETSEAEVFIRPYPDTGSSWQVSNGGGGSPLWSRDGGELFFVAQNRMMVASISTRPALRIGRPEILFEGGFNTSRARDFDVAPDGRFVAVRTGGGAVRTEMRLLLNWPQALKGKTPAAS